MIGQTRLSPSPRCERTCDEGFFFLIFSRTGVDTLSTIVIMMFRRTTTVAQGEDRTMNANSKLSKRTLDLLTDLVNAYYSGNELADQVFCDVCADEGLDVYETVGLWGTLVARRPMEPEVTY